MNKPWDKENKYAEGFLKEYDHWVLEVNYKQPTLGTLIIISKSMVEKVSELNNEELLELKTVMSELEETLSKIDVFKPDRFNYLQLGNVMHNLHFHMIPRYETSRSFDGKEWVDQTYGRFPPWIKEEENPETIRKIRDAVKPYLP